MNYMISVFQISKFKLQLKNSRSSWLSAYIVSKSLCVDWELLLGSGFCNCLHYKRQGVGLIDKVPLFPRSIALAVHESLQSDVCLLGKNTNFAGI